MLTFKHKLRLWWIENGPAVVVVAARLILAAVLAMTQGCGATQKVSRSAAAISVAAGEAITKAQAGAAAADAAARDGNIIDDPAKAHLALLSASDTMKDLCGPLQDIQAAAGVIQDQVPNLQDRTPFWQKALIAVCVLLSIGGLIYLLTVTGLWAVVRAAVGWLLALLPHPQVSKAKIDMDALDSAPTNPDLNAAIAARRTQSPVYNAAFAKLRKAKDAAAGRAARKDKP